MAPNTGAPWGRVGRLSALVCAAVVLLCGATASAAPLTCNAAPAMAPFLHQRPPGCWRPFADTSPWNRELATDAELDPRSAQLAGRVGVPRHLIAGWAGTGRDYARPTYFSAPGDPVFTLHCTKPWGPCPVEGMRIAIPDAAQPAGGDDGHL